MQHYRRKPLNLTNPSSGSYRSDTAVLPGTRSARWSATVPDSLGADLLETPAAVAQGTTEETALETLMADPAALVQQAAAILEEEMAMGGQAAQPVSPIDAMRPSLSPSMGSDGLLKEVHAFIDQLAQVMAQRPLPMTGPTYGLDSLGANVLSASSSLPLLRSPLPAPVGELTNLVFKVYNDSDQSVPVSFLGTDLWSSTGDRITSSAVTFMPQSLTLAPDEIAEVAMGILVPLGTPANTYSGLAMASGLSDVVGAIALEVGRMVQADKIKEDGVYALKPL
ncbi:MAG: hypothetical protein WCD18_17745 [Thermosynechococcaceae cyanobacterium]